MARPSSNDRRGESLRMSGGLRGPTTWLRLRAGGTPMSTILLRIRAAAALTFLGAALSGRAAGQEPLKFPFMKQTQVSAPESFFHPDLN
jgi:hypothetical protein